jgi:hypothetical protein
MDTVKKCVVLAAPTDHGNQYWPKFLYSHVKLKENLSLSLIKHYAMKAYGGVDV